METEKKVWFSPSTCGIVSLTVVRKNLISHRGKALAKLKAWLAGGDLEP